ncbi:MAG: endoribonuclease MazF [Thermovirgaceae bacterium]|nr:endoribonuclease MazF [Thermovirgaceae bacterium]
MTESAKEKPQGPVPVPDSGDIVWLDLNPASGHEQHGRRPALVVTPTAYNRASGLCFVLPITSREKGYPFEVSLPSHLETRGFVLADQGRTVDWSARNSSLTEKVPPDTLQKVRHLLKVLLVLE